MLLIIEVIFEDFYVNINIKDVKIVQFLLIQKYIFILLFFFVLEINCKCDLNFIKIRFNFFNRCLNDKLNYNLNCMYYFILQEMFC